MLPIIIVIIIIAIFFMCKKSENKEKFSNPPTQTDIDYLKNYIKVSKYTLDQMSKKISGNSANKFTTANELLNSIDTKINEITKYNNESNTNLNTLNDFYNNYTANLLSFIKEILSQIINYNNLLGFNSTTISSYQSAITYIEGLATNELKFKSLLKLINILKTDLIKVIFNKLIISNNNIAETINLLNPNIDYTSANFIPTDNLNTNFSDLTNTNFTTNSQMLSLPEFTTNTTANDLSSDYYKLDGSFLVTGSGSLPRIY